MKIACLIALAGMVFSTPTMLWGQEESAVQVAGLRVVGPGYGVNGTELRAFNQQSGTALALVVHAPENKKIVELDDAKCSLVEFTDDRGTNLLDGVDWDGFPEISSDGHYALVEVTSKKTPSQDASQLFARGTIHLRVAASAITEKIDQLNLEVGAKANVRQEEIEVMKVQGEDESLTLVLQINRNFRDTIRDIRFYTVNNDPIEVWGRGSFTFGNASQMEYNLDTNTIPKMLRVEIDLWQGLETLDLDFEVDAGVGF